MTLLLLSVVTIKAQDLTTKTGSVNSQNETAEPKIYVVLDITVHDSTMYEQYRINVEPIIRKYGGKYLVRSGCMSFDNDPVNKVVPLEGNWNPNRFVILQFDSIEQFQKFSKSDEYLKIVKLRRSSASTKSIIVKEYLKNLK